MMLRVQSLKGWEWVDAGGLKLYKYDLLKYHKH